MEKDTPATAAKTIAKAPPKVEEPKFERPKHWSKDTYRPKRWSVYAVPNCDLAPKALELLKSHGENVSYQVFSEGSAQDALTRGHNFSPLIYSDGKLIGSLGELELYFKRNFFNSILEGIR